MQINSFIKVIVISLSIITGLIVLVFIYLLSISQGKLKPYLDNKGKILANSLSEKTVVKIGNVKQGMFIKSKNTNNPILLYIHGGPAFPNYFLIDKFKPELEDNFTVCYWEQRGGGLSYTPEVSIESMNFMQLMYDAIEVTNYLRKRFNKEKIYILAHSGGSTIALMAVQKAPELFHAYIAIAQITNQTESEKIAYQYMLKHYLNAGNKKALIKLKKYNVLDSDSNVIPFFKSVTRDQYMHELGIGTMHNMNSVFWDIFVPVWKCNAYTLKEKINIWKSKFSFLPKTNLINEEFATDFALKITKIDIPIYFFSGKFDLTVNINLSKSYYKKLNAPLKGFYTFNKSAHSPIFEEPLLVKQIIEKDILNGKNNLSDKN